jgi:DNA modification methylase
MSDMSNHNVESKVLKTELIEWRKLKFIQDDNFKEWIGSGDERLMRSILKYQFIDPFKVWEHNGDIYCLDGKHRTIKLEKVNESGVKVPDLLPATFIDCTDIKQAAELVLVYSSAYARITNDGLVDFISKFDLDFPDLTDFDMIEFEGKFGNNTGETKDVIAKSLQEQFIIPPFSILDSRQGYWQKRKQLWHSLGFDSQETREDVELIAQSGQSSAIYELRNQMRNSLKREPTWDEIIDYAKKKGLHVYEGASVFDPVLAEVCYKWFCPEGGTILDPFAGGSVRGIVAGVAGFEYLGIDLRNEQVEANKKQWQSLALNIDKLNCQWMVGDSNDIPVMIGDKIMFDFVFSCPPYHDLEKYSDDPADLSNMNYEEFIAVYKSIIKKSIALLKDNRFAFFVVGDIRDKQGFYRNFVSDTIEAFELAGAKYYNEMILINVAGSLPIRVGQQFKSGRKVGKMHQNVLVFYKGDPKKIKEEFPEIKVAEYLQELNDNPNIALS